MPDARFFSRPEMDALKLDETWRGAIAAACKGLEPTAPIWTNHPDLQDSASEAPDRWRIWL